MVQNGLGAKVSTAIEASGFADEDGRSVNPEIVFQPPDVTLEPGEKTLVKVVVRLGDEIRAGTDYVGAVTIPGLADRRLELLLRSRRPAEAVRAPAKKQSGRSARQVASRRAPPKPRPLARKARRARLLRRGFQRPGRTATPTINRGQIRPCRVAEAGTV